GRERESERARERESERARERESGRAGEREIIYFLPLNPSLLLSLSRSFPDRHCLIFSQSLRKLARPMSVRGCLINCSITLNGMVAMSAPSRADSITCSVWRMLAARIWVLNP